MLIDAGDSTGNRDIMTWTSEQHQVAVAVLMLWRQLEVAPILPVFRD